MRLYIAFALTVLSASLMAQTTIQQVLQSIQQNNLQLQALAQEHTATVADLKAENVLAGPSIEYSPFYLSDYKGVAESELIVSEEFDFPTLYASRRREARLTREACDLAYDAARVELLLQAQILCLDLIRQNQLHQMLDERLRTSDAMLQLYQRRMDAGDANILELNKVKLDRMDALTEAAACEAERTSLLQQLQVLNGGQTIDFTITEWPEWTMPTDYQSYAQLALASDAAILSAQAAQRIASQQLTTARQQWLPSFSVGYRRNTDADLALHGFLVGMSFPLTSNRSRVAAARSRQTCAEILVAESKMKAEVALQAQWNELQRLHRVLDHCDTPLLEQSLTLLSKALQHGELSALDYYTEVSNIYEKLQSHIDLHYQYNKLLAELYSVNL